jgi:hypothetical protein
MGAKSAEVFRVRRTTSDIRLKLEPLPLRPAAYCVRLLGYQLIARPDRPTKLNDRSLNWRSRHLAADVLASMANPICNVREDLPRLIASESTSTDVAWPMAGEAKMIQVPTTRYKLGNKTPMAQALCLPIDPHRKRRSPFT